MIKTVYRVLIPAFVKRKMAIYLDDSDKKVLRKNIISYLKSLSIDQLDDQKASVLRFLQRNYLGVFPYSFRYKYREEDVQVFKDDKSGLHYVVENGKRIYHKRSWDAAKVRRAYNFLRMEQDNQSPHRYLTDDFNIGEGDVVVDVGVAEGNFALEIIEKVSKIYFFETDPEWIEALELTFKEWKDKIVIVNKFVSDINNDSNVSLDEFFKKDDEIDFIKIDVDGAESKLLAGADDLLSNANSKKVAICTYHKQNDAEEFDELLVDKGFKTEFSDGYMLFIYDPELSEPYLRKGLIRAVKG